MAGVALPEDMISLFNGLNSNFELVKENIKNGAVRLEEPPNFTLPGFWDKLGTSVKALSAECTKFCLAFSQPPAPSAKDCQPLVEGLEKSVIAMVTIFHNLPASQGMTIRSCVQESLVSMVTAAQQLLEVVRTYGCQGSTSQLQSTGTVWEKCDSFASLPPDNKTAVHRIGKSTQDLVLDAISELEEAKKEDEELEADPPEDEDLVEDEEEPRWRSEDRQLLGPTLGLMKVAHRTSKKLSDVMIKKADCSSVANNVELDNLTKCLQRLSPIVDDLALTAYPPLDQQALRKEADNLGSVISDLLSMAKHSHYTDEDDEKWVTFLGEALQHNIAKIGGFT